MPSPPELLQQAKTLEQAGRLPEAIAAYERLLALTPERPNTWYNLARLQRRAGRPEAALASYQRALDLGVEQPEEVRLNRGVILSDDLRRPDQAEAELDAALALNPAYVPALLNLANLNEDRGRRAPALALYERALAVDPDCRLALARLVGLRPAPDAAELGRVRAALADPRTPAEDRIDLGFALGKALDGGGAWDEAFAAYAEANRVLRLASGARYERAAHSALVDRLCAAFTPERVAALQTGSAAAPVFICGMFRSGSTLTEQILAAHPQVTAGGELELLPELVRTRLSPFPESLAGLPRERLAALAAEYETAVRRLFPGAGLVTDKRPDNVLYVGLIKTLFPKARIVHTRRHPLDNCLSVYFLQLHPRMSYALDLLDAGHYLAEERRLTAHWKRLFGDDILELDYDALVADPEPQVRRLLGFLGLPWDPACLQFHRLDNAVRTASVWQVREPLHGRSSGRWRHYERHLGPLRQVLEGGPG
jgi:hypothetical protein